MMRLISSAVGTGIPSDGFAVRSDASVQGSAVFATPEIMATSSRMCCLLSGIDVDVELLLLLLLGAAVAPDGVRPDARIIVGASAW